ncbi:MAG TPA: hypothetical protein VLK25_00665 [Allosphingosinicella sp.]|nr:hypothetical protein [Allosphingosinicella sp.]
MDSKDAIDWLLGSAGELVERRDFQPVAARSPAWRLEHEPLRPSRQPPASDGAPATGDRKLEVEIGISDDWSGVQDWPDPVARIDFWLTPPDWPISWGMSGSDSELISGTDLNGTWRLNRWLEEDASIGTWTVRWITVTDRAGNTTRLEDAALEEFEAQGADLSFENLP